MEVSDALKRTLWEIHFILYGYDLYLDLGTFSKFSIRFPLGDFIKLAQE